MKISLPALMVLVSVCLLPGRADAEDRAFRFLAVGDLPYSAAQVPLFNRLVKQSEQEDFEFLMHVGDIQGGGIPCTDSAARSIRDLFGKYPKPVIYTPGDNEWTDCVVEGDDPLERLANLRKLFFADRKVLRLDQLGIVRQSRHKQYAKYVENYRFKKAGVLFVVVHVVGSGNNYKPDHPPSMKEYTERNVANLAFLKESYVEAAKADVRGVAVVIHANPGFETGLGAGFKDFLASMRGFLSGYDRPVVCIHGDSHYYRIDKPFRDASGKTFLGFTRIEVFGSPNVAGLIITVDPDDPQIFSTRPYYLKKK
jgi:hypothetical protein